MYIYILYIYITFKSLKTLLTYRSSVILKKGVLRVCCGFSGAYPCVDMISIKLQSSFVETVLLRGCPAVDLLRVCGASFLEKISGGVGLLLNTDNFIYDF